MLNELEKKLLEIFAKRHVLRKSELNRIFDGNGSIVVNSLVEKGLITEISAIGERSFAITRKGIKFIEEIV